MRRRRLLAAAASGLTGAAAGLAGCLGASGDDSPQSTTRTTTATVATTTATVATTTATTATTTALSRRSVGDSAAVEGGTVTLAAVALHRFIREDLKTDSPNTRAVAEPGRKYVTATLVEDGLGRPPVTATLRLDGELAGSFQRGLYDGYDWTPHTYRLFVPLALDATADRGTVVFESRAGDPLAAWALPDRVLARLNDPPVFEVRSVSVPDSVASGDDVPVTIHLGNTGGSDGTFVATLGLVDTSHPRVVEVEVAGGERRTVERRVPTHGGDEVTVVLDWGRRQGDADGSGGWRERERMNRQRDGTPFRRAAAVVSVAQIQLASSPGTVLPRKQFGREPSSPKPNHPASDADAP
jgi:hypothetical protein